MTAVQSISVQASVWTSFGGLFSCPDVVDRVWLVALTSLRCCSATLIRIWEDAANLFLSAPLGAFARTAVRMLHIAAQTCTIR